MKKVVRIILIVLLLTFSIYSWGRVGHETIVYIAEQNLDRLTLERIKPLIGSESLEEVSIWADQYKQNHRSTASWHYVNIPVYNKVTLNNVSQFYSITGRTNNDNLVYQIKYDINLLKSGKGSFKENQAALWFLIHFIGDLHMPLHVGDDNDRGGNGKQIRFFNPLSHSNKGHVTNLHSLWDNLIQVKASEDPEQLGLELNNKINEIDKKKWASGSIDSWAYESYSLSKEIEKEFPRGPSTSVILLPKEYFYRMRPACDIQLQKAGIRLANLLKEIYKK